MPYYKHIHRVVEGPMAGHECYQAEGCDGRLYLREYSGELLEVTIRPIKSKRERKLEVLREWVRSNYPLAPHRDEVVLGLLESIDREGQ